MKGSAEIRTLFLDIGGVLLTAGWDHHARKRAATSAAEVMLPLEQLKRIDPDTELWAAVQKMDCDRVNPLPVTQDQHVIGMLSWEDVTTFLHTLQELGA